ncbi:MAG: phosphoesterase [Clostridiales bacterium]|nr:phosphoesterase [Clostridiales bacterium]
MNVVKRFVRTYPQIWTLSYFALYLPWFTLLEGRNTRDCLIIQLPIDRLIPFCEYFVIPYLLWFLYVGAAVAWLLLRRPREAYYRFAGMFFGGMTVCLMLYTFFHTGLNLRPVIDPEKNVFTWLVSRIWAVDTSTNVCPSIHVYATLAIQAGLTRNGLEQSHPVIYRASGVLGVLIILSTVFLKQHSVLDVVCALLLAGGMHRAVYGSAPTYWASRRELART